MREFAAEPEGEHDGDSDDEGDGPYGQGDVAVGVGEIDGVMADFVVEEQAEDGEEAGGEERRDSEGDSQEEAGKETEFAERDSEEFVVRRDCFTDGHGFTSGAAWLASPPRIPV